MGVPRRAGRPPTQGERTEAMKRRLTGAAIASLVERGHAHTTAVEVCRRAGVTRGAFHHHFASLGALLTDALEQLYAETMARPATPTRSLADLIGRAFERTRRPQFKAVIEIWLAARNDAELGRELAPAIARMSKLFAPADNAGLARLVRKRNRALYRLAVEALIGLALGRAVSTDGRGVAHEDDVVELLRALARDAEKKPEGGKR